MKIIWLLGSLTVLFEIWMVVHFGILAIQWNCDKIVKLVPGDENRWFQIASRLAYHVCMILFVITQTLWLYYANEYSIKSKARIANFYHWIIILHLIVVNLSIYLKTTLDEAKESFEALESGVKFDKESFEALEPQMKIHQNHQISESKTKKVEEISCNSGKNLNKSYEIRLQKAHHEYLEPIGFAIQVETLLSFILFFLLFAEVEEHEMDEAAEVFQYLLFSVKKFESF